MQLELREPAEVGWVRLAGPGNLELGESEHLVLVDLVRLVPWGHLSA